MNRYVTGVLESDGKAGEIVRVCIGGATKVRVDKGVSEEYDKLKNYRHSWHLLTVWILARRWATRAQILREMRRRERVTLGIKHRKRGKR